MTEMPEELIDWLALDASAPPVAAWIMRFAVYRAKRPICNRVFADLPSWFADLPEHAQRAVGI